MRPSPNLSLQGAPSKCRSKQSPKPSSLSPFRWFIYESKDFRALFQFFIGSCVKWIWYLTRCIESFVIWWTLNLIWSFLDVIVLIKNLRRLSNNIMMIFIADFTNWIYSNLFNNWLKLVWKSQIKYFIFNHYPALIIRCAYSHRALAPFVLSQFETIQAVWFPILFFRSMMDLFKSSTVGGSPFVKCWRIAFSFSPKGLEL